MTDQATAGPTGLTLSPLGGLRLEFLLITTHMVMAIIGVTSIKDLGVTMAKTMVKAIEARIMANQMAGAIAARITGMEMETETGTGMGMEMEMGTGPRMATTEILDHATITTNNQKVRALGGKRYTQNPGRQRTDRITDRITQALRTVWEMEWGTPVRLEPPRRVESVQQVQWLL
jgi:hypothetical protein